MPWRPLLAAGMLAIAVAALLWGTRGSMAAPPPERAGEPAPAPGPAAPGAAAAALPAELHRRLAPGSRTPMRVARVRSGVRCPDGSHLPLLNGVPGAPPITRAPELGPVPEVVAVIVDQHGVAWYEHADGSATTTRYRTVLVDGEPRRDIETVHNARLPDAWGVQRRENAR